MMRSLYSAVSGLTNQQTAMDVIGNNVSNVSTIGYKSSRVVFQDLYSQTISSASASTSTSGGSNSKQVGLGVTTAAIQTSTLEGSTESTGETLDFAISGDGYFIIQGSDGSYYYTRNGNFTVDSDGYLVTQNGNYVMGVIGDATLEPSETTTSFTLKNSTSSVSLDGTLADDDAGVYLTDPENLTDDDALEAALELLNTGDYDGTYTITTSLDDDGTTLTWTATNTTDSTITLVGSYDSGVLTFSTPATTDDDGNTVDSVPLFTISLLDEDGNALSDDSLLTEGTLSSAFTISTEEPSVETTYNNATLSLSNLSKIQITDYIDATSSDGAYSELYYGSYSSYSIDSSGAIYATRTNDDGSTETLELGTLALATFANSAGLDKVGDSLYQTSVNSGEAQINYVGESCGTLESGYLEMSNVDLASEMTAMIVAQRAFQANSRIITTSDTMLEELVNLKRS